MNIDEHKYKETTRSPLSRVEMPQGESPVPDMPTETARGAPETERMSFTDRSESAFIRVHPWLHVPHALWNSHPDRPKVFSFMAVIRILVDGYSLLHNWPEIAPGKPRFSAAARNELIQMLTRYYDAAGTPISVFFDGASPVIDGTLEMASTNAVEVLFSSAGQTADQMIERAAHRFAEYGEILAVTDDLAERGTVVALGGLASSCLNFIRTVETALADLDREIRRHNREERDKFKRRA